MPAQPPLDITPPTPTRGIRVGIGGWVYAPWRDNFYPQGLVQRRELEYASRRVTAIEVNGTHYRAQTRATYAKWAAETPAGFVFSLKAPMRITQARDLARVGPQVEDFAGGVLALGDRLGPLVWQFDAGAAVTRDALKAFVAALPRVLDGRLLRHVLDVREPGLVDARYVALARAQGVATVFTDSPEHPSFADVTADFVYARLMRARSAVKTGYPPVELDAWAGRLHAWAAGGQPGDLPLLDPSHAPPTQPREVFAFFIAADKERNPAAAMALIDRL